MPEALISQAVPLLLMLGIFYFLVLRPQRQEAAEHAKLVAGLKKGDRVVTSSGVHGTIHEAAGDTLVLEISKGAFLTIDRDSVKRVAAAAQGA